MSTIRDIFREEVVKFGPSKGKVRRYQAYQSREGGFVVYEPGTGSPTIAERLSPNPTTLAECWRLLELGYRIRLRTASGDNAVFGRDNGLKIDSAA